MENKNDAPEWAKDLINTVNELKQRVDTTFPEAEKKQKPDFSAFVEKLKFSGMIPDKE